MSLTLDWPYKNNIKGKIGTTAVHGICMSLSCHWARATLKNKGSRLTQPIPTNINAMGAMFAVRAKQHAVVDSAGGSFDSRVDAWHQGFFEPLCLEGELDSNGAGGGCDLTSAHGVYILTIYGNGGHTMAFARLPSYSVFFDPNIGQYACKASVFSSFKKDVRGWLSITYPDLQSSWYVYRVTLS